MSLNHINLSNGGKSIFRELVLKTGAKLTSVEEAIRASQSNIVILAVPKDFYEKQPIHLLEGKVVIDVSNRNSIYAKGESQVFRTTLYIAILRIARNFLETRENIKISTHPFYHINLG